MISALVGHLVGDYLLQNDWLAQGKKRDSGLCAIHCAIWTACVMLFAGWIAPTTSWWVWPVLFVTHFIQDRTNIVRWWMSLVGQDSFATGPCSPWSIIVVDNVWHIVTIWIVWRFLA